MESGDKVILAISGGPDSVALFYLLKEIESEYNLKISLAHVNHLLRGENSDEDELFVKKLSEQYNIEYFPLREDIYKVGKERKIGLEEAGREVRYNWFKKIYLETKSTKVALAHNLDDNIETFMFRMMRGTSLAGLSSIPVKRDFYIRPIMCFTKEEILEYLDRNGYKYRIDESNFENIYTRNKIRLDLIPLIEKEFNSAFKEKISNLIGEIDELKKYEKEKIENSLMKISKDGKIEIKKLLAESKRDITLIIAEFLKNKNIDLGKNKLEEIISILEADGCKKIDLGNNKTLYKGYNFLFIEENRNKNDDIMILKIGEEVLFGEYLIRCDVIGKEVKDKRNWYLDFEKLQDKEKFIVRKKLDGDKFIPSGMTGSKKLKNLFVDMKIDKSERERVPVILNGDNIVWIAGIRGSNLYKEDENTKKIIKLSVEEVHNGG